VRCRPLPLSFFFQITTFHIPPISNFLAFSTSLNLRQAMLFIPRVFANMRDSSPYPSISNRLNMLELPPSRVAHVAVHVLTGWPLLPSYSALRIVLVRRSTRLHHRHHGFLSPPPLSRSFQSSESYGYTLSPHMPLQTNRAMTHPPPPAIASTQTQPSLKSAGQLPLQTNLFPNGHAKAPLSLCQIDL